MSNSVEECLKSTVNKTVIIMLKALEIISPKQKSETYSKEL